MEELLRWGQENGIQLPKGIEFIKDGKKGFTCICSNSQDLQTPRFIVPLNALIIGELAEKVFGTKNNGLLKFLLAKLKYDHNPTLIDNNTVDLQKKFAPYINVLPTVPDSPLIWNPREINLLKNTNIGNSIRERLYAIFEQWHSLIENNIFLQTFKLNIENDLELFNQWDELSMQQIYDEIILKTVNSTPSHWCSFSAYLWSHLIFTSRAFPEYIINPKNCDESSIMLLPIIDLLNHDYTSRVEWSTNNNRSFILTLLNDNIEQDDELFNNYGPKGNEELLNGYGFVLEDNICDSVTLKIKLPLPVIENILKNEPSISLPTIDDYTTYAFEVDQKSNLADDKTRTAENYKDGITYLLNTNNDTSLTSLLQVFTFLSKHDFEIVSLSIRARLDGLQGLRNALQNKLDILKYKVPDHEYLQYKIDEYRSYCSKIYRESQIKILKHSISVLKNWEKQWLKEFKPQLLTMDKILKCDKGFVDTELPAYFADNTGDDISFDSTFDLFVLWIAIKIQNHSFIEKYKSVQSDLESYIARHSNDEKKFTINEDTISFYNTYFPQKDNQNKIKIENIHVALNYVGDNSFTRSSKLQETILVTSNE